MTTDGDAESSHDDAKDTEADNPLGAWDRRLLRAVTTADAVPAAARLLRWLAALGPMTALVGVMMQLVGRRQPGDPRLPVPSGWLEWGAVLTSIAIPVGIAAAVYAVASLVATYGARLDLAIWDTVEQDNDEPAPQPQPQPQDGSDEPAG